MIKLALLSLAATACSIEVPAPRACQYTQAAEACCGGCAAAAWCNIRTCACEDIESPCGGATSTIGTGTPPDPGVVPAGTVGKSGGTVDRLWFATTGDTRPGSCDATNDYPKAAITQIAASMKALKVQFALDLGDHMFVCNQSDPEAIQQMGFYIAAAGGGPATWLMTMGNHECGTGACFAGAPHDANFAAYMAALQRPQPYYSLDVSTSLGLARFVVIADDSWSAAQAAWLESTLADADSKAKYTIVARHHPVTGTRTGVPEIPAAIARHRYSLVLTAHDHSYSHSKSEWNGRTVVVGLGGAPGSAPPGFGTVLQNQDGTLAFVLRDAFGHPTGTPWTVPPQ